MRLIIVSNYVSLDGYIAGPHGEIDWFIWDEEMEKYSIDLMSSIDTLLFGRVTYELMADYWPTAKNENPIIKEKMNNLPKIVFSNTLKSVNWNNSQIAKGSIGDIVKELKQKQGLNIAIFGSGSIVSTLTELELIDEFRIIVNPVILGNGIPLFRNIKKHIILKLINSKQFTSGNVLFQYKLYKGK